MAEGLRVFTLEEWRKIHVGSCLKDGWKLMWVYVWRMVEGSCGLIYEEWKNIYVSSCLRNGRIFMWVHAWGMEEYLCGFMLNNGWKLIWVHLWRMAEGSCGFMLEEWQEVYCGENVILMILFWQGWSMRGKNDGGLCNTYEFIMKVKFIGQRYRVLVPVYHHYHNSSSLPSLS